MAPDYDDIQRIAAREVRFFLQRVPRATGHSADMQQEAIVALITACRTFDPARGEWCAYASAAAQKAVRRYLSKERGRPSKMTREMMDLSRGIEPGPGPALLLHNRQVAARVRSVLNRLDYSSKKVGVANALGEGTPQELAKRKRVPVKDIYYARAQMVRRAEHALPLRALWEELRP
jgi:RNA polymerase sigma factor (sigma-70 family)